MKRKGGKKKKSEPIDSRTQFEDSEVVNAPLSIELEVAAKAIVKAINDLPPEARQPAEEAALLLIDGFQKSVDAVINQLPGDFEYLDTDVVKKKALQLEQEINKDPSKSVLKEVAALLEEIDDSVATLTAPPSYPHYLSTKLVADQTDKMKQYIKDNVIG